MSDENCSHPDDMIIFVPSGYGDGYRKCSSCGKRL